MKGTLFTTISLLPHHRGRGAPEFQPEPHADHIRRRHASAVDAGEMVVLAPLSVIHAPIIGVN